MEGPVGLVWLGVSWLKVGRLQLLSQPRLKIVRVNDEENKRHDINIKDNYMSCAIVPSTLLDLLNDWCVCVFWGVTRAVLILMNQAIQVASNAVNAACHAEAQCPAGARRCSERMV